VAKSPTGRPTRSRGVVLYTLIDEQVARLESLLEVHEEIAGDER